MHHPASRGFAIMCLSSVILAAVLIPLACSKGKETPLYLNTERPFEERAADLVSRMTLEQKAAQMLYSAPAIDSLGVPAYNWWNECLHGVARAGNATVFPQAIGLAAMWDDSQLKTVATAISDEARAKYNDYIAKNRHGIYQGLTFWTPNINLFRDPRWGRGMETYGEDPYLTGALAVSFITGLQGDDPTYLKVVATAKHFAVHSGPETTRHEFDAQVNDRDLYESYLPQFRMAIVDGKVESVMGAYNRVRGEAANGSKFLLQDILRGAWGFKGYVVSDCWAIQDFFQGHKVVATAEEAVALAVNRGCDLNCGDLFAAYLPKAVAQGLTTEAALDTALIRLFTARMKLGMFDPKENVRYSSIPISAVGSPEHAAVALESARKSIVLLKNKDNALPLKKDLKTVAVIGPNADDVEVLLGNYNGTPASPVTPLRGIREKLGPDATVLYAQGCDVAEGMPAFSVIPSTALSTQSDSGMVAGLKGEYFANREFTGEPALIRIDPTIDFSWLDETPVPGSDLDGWGIRWTGMLTVPSTGTYAIGGNGMSGFRIFIDDKQMVAFQNDHEPKTTSASMKLTAGKAYAIRIEYFDKEGDASMKLVWAAPRGNLQSEAVAAAKKADVVILVMGLSPRLEGEEMSIQVKGFSGGDRLTLNLPKVQEDLMKAVTAVGKPTVLVLMNGSAIAPTWAIDNIPGIVEAWYPGQAAGSAIADVLFGDYNPGGRLPVTFYASVDQLPAFDDYSMAGRTYRFFTGKPLFPFGYGLSYTTFAYSNLQVPATVANGEKVTIKVDVKNTGSIVGNEVVQLYITDDKASVRVPIRNLAGFDRVTLNPGEVKTVSFTIDPRQLSVITEDSKRIVEPGTFTITAGGKQPGFTGLADAATTSVVTGSLTVTGEPLELSLQ